MSLLLPLLLACAARCSATDVAAMGASPAGRALRGGWQASATQDDHIHSAGEDNSTGEDSDNSTAADSDNSTVPTTTTITTTVTTTQVRRNPTPSLPFPAIGVALPPPQLPVIWVPLPLPYPFVPAWLAAAAAEHGSGSHVRHPSGTLRTNTSTAPMDEVRLGQAQTKGRMPSLGYPGHASAPGVALQPPATGASCEGFVILHEDVDLSGSSFGGLCSTIKKLVGSSWTDRDWYQTADVDPATLYADWDLGGGQRFKVRSVRTCPPLCRLSPRTR